MLGMMEKHIYSIFKFSRIFTVCVFQMFYEVLIKGMICSVSAYSES